MAIASSAQNACKPRHNHFDPIDLRLTDDDALPSSVQCVFKRGGDLTLCDLLTLTAWRLSKGELQRFGQGIGYHLKRCCAVGHHRPFLSYSIRDVATDQAAQARLGFSRKCRG